MVTEKGPKHAQNQFLTQFLENTLNLPNIFMVLVSQVQKNFKIESFNFNQRFKPF